MQAKKSCFCQALLELGRYTGRRQALMNAERPYPLTPQYKTVIRQVRERCSPESADKIDATLTDIDRQMFTNLSTCTSERFPGVVLPYTTFSLSVNPGNQSQEPERRILAITMGGFGVPPDGHPVNPDVYYNPAFQHMSEAKKSGIPTTIEFLVMGQVSGEGGHTTKQFNKATKREGFAPELTMVKSVIKSRLPKDTREREEFGIAFHGRSMGAIKVLELASGFDEVSDIKKQVHLDSPARIPAIAKEYQSGNLQILIGYALEGLLKDRFKSLTKEIVDTGYAQALQEAFEEKGINTKDNCMQRLRKEKIVYLNVRNILKSKIYKEKDFPFPVTAKVGGFDPITMTRAGIINTLLEKKEVVGQVEVDFLKSTHSIYNYPIEEWAKALE